MLKRNKFMTDTVRGSYTIEAALIFPFILFIITALIYLGFYLHDQNKLEIVINETLLRGRNLIRNEANMETGGIDYEEYYKRGIFYSLQDNLFEKQQKIYKYLIAQLNNGFFLADPYSVNVTVSHTELSIDIKADMVLPFIGMQSFFSGSGTIVIAAKSSAVNNTTEFIRIFDVFSGAAEEIPLINETLSRLQQLFSKSKE